MKFLFSKQNNSSDVIYLDHAAATPIDPIVKAAMDSHPDELWHNPNALYKSALLIRDSLENSRARIASILGARPGEVYFVDGATEANNIAILGVVSAWKKQNIEKTPHIVTVCIEHSSVLETCRALERDGANVTYLSVNQNGQIDIKELKDCLSENTVIVSVGYVNGEIGTIQDIKEITKTIRHFRKHQKTDSAYPYFHTDAVQAVNYLPVGVPQLGVDLMTINASKIYGPKKSAVLFIKTDIEIDPLTYGGSQESGLRPGTENPRAIIGMESSLVRAVGLQDSENVRLFDLRKYIISEMMATIPNVHINANGADVIPNIVNISIPDISSEEIVLRLDARNIMASVKSACKAGDDGDSHVIMAIRGDNQENMGSIRFSMGRETTQEQLEHVVETLTQIVSDMTDTHEKYHQD